MFICSLASSPTPYQKSQKEHFVCYSMFGISSIYINLFKYTGTKCTIIKKKLSEMGWTGKSSVNLLELGTPPCSSSPSLPLERKLTENRNCRYSEGSTLHRRRTGPNRSKAPHLHKEKNERSYPSKAR